MAPIKLLVTAVLYGGNHAFCTGGYINIKTEIKEEMRTFIPHFSIQKYYSLIFEASTTALTIEMFWRIASVQPTYKESTSK